MQKLYTIAELAQLMRVSKVQVYNWLHAGKLHGIRLGGPKSNIRFRESDIQKFISSGSPTEMRK